MFKPIKRASKGRKFSMKSKAEDIATENGWIFTGEIEPNKGSAYTAEFITADDPEPFYGWAIASTDNGDYVEEIDYIFGAGQLVYFNDNFFEITEEDYYETIGAGI